MAAPKTRVLVVDDDAAVGMVLVALLGQAGYEARHVDSGDAALAALLARGVDVVLSDVRMPGMDGLELVVEVKKRAADVPVILLTAHGTVALAVEAMKAGASDFLLKPFDRDEVLYAVGKALASVARAAERPPEPPAVTGGEGAVIGSSAAMRDATARIEKAAPTIATVLLRGASGTGKEVAARELHRRSPRRDAPFVAVHCGALPESLLESELFGYEKGAFTGAIQRKPGRVELAAGGTLFLDEIGDVSLPAQVKLLRLLQEREYQSLGGTTTAKADVRFVAATHRDLEAMVRDGTFREDLFFRLNVVPIRMPSLDERREDIPELARRFVARLGAANGRPQLGITPDALDALAAADWPGNVRELLNFVERLVVFADGDAITGTVVAAELGRRRVGAPVAQTATAAPVAAAGTLDARRADAERDAVRDALDRAKGNRTQAARLLGVSRRTLYNKLAELGLE